MFCRHRAKVVIVTNTNQRDLQLRFPAANGYLRVSRLTATTLAADLGFDVDALDDLRLAVAEVVNYLVESSTADQIVLRLLAGQDGFRLEGTTVVENDESDHRAEPAALGVRPEDTGVVDDSAVDDLLHAVLGATTDDYRIGVVDDRRYVWLVKHTAGHTDPEGNPSVDASVAGTEDGAE
jgi:hypothetical protein